METKSTYVNNLLFKKGNMETKSYANNINYPSEGTLAYIRELGEFPPLTRKREGELAFVIQKYKGGKARRAATDELVKHNLKLVVDEAFEFSRKNYRIAVDEFIGAGNEGIMKAAERFNPRKYKTKFSTYAMWWIRQSMHRLVYKNTYPVAVPEYISNGLARKNRAENKNRMKGNKSMTTAQLMDSLKISEKAVRKLAKANIKTFSLDHAPEVDNDGNGAVANEMIPDNKATDPRKGAMDTDDYAKLYEALEQLDPQSKEIIMARFLGSEVVRLKKLGKKFGVSHERIRQISEKALDKLRSKLNKYR